ncbi:class I SAM-dependent methyltransferase [Microvirga rosea]|uniref:class I SAM-dependent methyltransferase n=1 Tax=Microvirga rosea TaxID=2715425 RepID=UPI001D0A6D5E|nr:class I SAM-dependent methyltransferase [Microvirga rosea]MCB8820745.1 class I SAM-dependent methyltransferase [Microvirga rosea]
MSDAVFGDRMIVDPEAEYLRLRLLGEPGWGGSNFPTRRAGWANSIVYLNEADAIPRPPARLLELGCGNGMVSALFAERGYDIDGVDLSSVAVAWAREQFAEKSLQGRFQCGNVSAMPFFPAKTFDLVIDGNCLHCLLDEARGLCLAEVRRVLKANGTFVVSTMCGEPKTDILKRNFDPAKRQLLERGQPYRTLKPVNELTREIHEAGFQITHQILGEGRLWDHAVIVCRMKP